MTDLEALRDELDDFAKLEEKVLLSKREERIIAGFEEIQRFVEKQKRQPEHGEGKDIFERLYAVRLDRLRELEDWRTLLAPLDHQGLLDEHAGDTSKLLDALDDDALLAELEGVVGGSDVNELRHVRSTSERRAAEAISHREKCEDFDQFQPLFEKAETDLQSGARVSRSFGKDASIELGNFFILGGQLVYVAEVGEIIKAPNGQNDARLRVIFSNSTESNLLRRSLQRALYKDEAGRRITEPDAGPLFADTWDEDDVESGTIYVLRSLSEHPFIKKHHELIHKIGVTGGKVETRIAHASRDATYLQADVEVVATYKLAGINRTKLENLFHRLFSPAQIDLTIQDRFGHPVRPREWFLVPIHIVDEVVQRLRDGSIEGVVYDPESASLVG